MLIKKRVISYLRRIYYCFLRLKYFLSHLLILWDVRKNNSVNICFIISSLPMWRLQSFYDRIIKDSRYNVYIILLPFDTFSGKQQQSCIAELRRYFDTRSISYIDASVEEISEHRWKVINPQIIFYQQMYSNIYHGCCSISNNLGKLLCYLPYGIITIKGDRIYNNKYTNLAWRLFYPTELHADYARSHSYNHARNVRIVGEPDAILFSNESGHHVNDKIKRVIWAPHYSIAGESFIKRTSFLWMAHLMLELAKDYIGRITFILKPHPRLVSTLYSLPEWGKQKTDAYFAKWTNQDNLQIETGQYIDLFKSSDAMIHDCGSFTAEYLFTANPVMFISSDFDSVYNELDYFGAKCMDLHYHGSSKDDIVNFLETVVLKDKDPLKEDRLLFRDTTLLQNGNNSVADAIYSSMTRDLFKH